MMQAALPAGIRFGMLRKSSSAAFRQTGEVFYIGGADVLPAPLEEQEEAKAIAGLSDSDNREARSMLIEHNLRLVVYIAQKFDNTGVGVEDLISIGTIGLIKAINTFNPEKKIKLATYASRCIENEILMYLRRNNKTKMEVSIDEPLNVDWDGNELLLSDILGTDEDMIYRDLERGSGVQPSGPGHSQAVQTGADHHLSAVRSESAGWQGKDTEGGGGSAGYFPILYFQAGKTDHAAAEKRDCTV